MAGVQVTLAATADGRLAVTMRAVSLLAVVAHRVVTAMPLPSPLRSALVQRVSAGTSPAVASRLRRWRGLVRRALARTSISVVRARPGSYVVSRRHDLVVRRAPGGGFFVRPDRQKMQLRRLGRSSFLAWSEAEVEELGPGTMLVTAGPAQDHRVIPLVAGASLIAPPEAEQERWLEHERALLGYLATQHILGVLKTYDINCVLDVGANRGQFGQALRKGGYRGHIVSFEPVPGVVEHLRRLTEHDETWSVHAVALGRESGLTTMQVVPDQATLSSMLAPSAYGRQRFPRMTTVAPTEVPVRRLDSLLDSVTESIPDPRLYLKLDTQGFDLEVFSGVGDRIRDIVALQSELALLRIYEGMPRMPEALRIYEEAGFEVSGLFPVSREFSTTRILEYDCILVRASAVTPRDLS